MKATEIKSIIKEASKGKAMWKWTVPTNTSTKIVLENDFEAKFIIRVMLDNDNHCVIVEDDYNSEYIFIGDTRWDDVKTVDEGLKLAIKVAVNMFYYYY